MLFKSAFTKNKKQFYFGHLLTLTAGAVIYLLFEKSLLMFEWLDIYFSFIDVDALRGSVKDIRPFFA